jgi:hypothetical protein
MGENAAQSPDRSIRVLAPNSQHIDRHGRADKAADALRNNSTQNAQTGNSVMQTKLRLVSAVKCRKCAHLVMLATTERLPHEFGVQCLNCGQRGFYLASDIKVSDADQATRNETASGGLRKAS